MLKVTCDEVALDDDAAVAEIVELLDLPDHGPKSDLPHLGSSTMPFWARYLHGGHVFSTWRRGKAIWVGVSPRAGTLRQITIAGLDEKDAALLLSEFIRKHKGGEGIRLSQPDVERLASEVVATREHRAEQATFQAQLRRVRNSFSWENGEAVFHGASKLPADDMELLRKVYERLPGTVFAGRQASALVLDDELCPLCGNPPTKRATPLKRRADALKRLKVSVDEHAGHLFKIWAKKRVRPGHDLFTTSTVLYDDYVSWTAKYGDTVTDRRNNKNTLLTRHRWGKLMIEWPFEKTRWGKGKGYRVTLRSR